MTVSPCTVWCPAAARALGVVGASRVRRCRNAQTGRSQARCPSMVGGIIPQKPAHQPSAVALMAARVIARDRKSTRLNSSHLVISYAVFCLKKKKKTHLHGDDSRSNHLPQS